MSDLEVYTAANYENNYDVNLKCIYFGIVCAQPPLIFPTGLN